MTDISLFVVLQGPEHGDGPQEIDDSWDHELPLDALECRQQRERQEQRQPAYNGRMVEGPEALSCHFTVHRTQVVPMHTSKTSAHSELQYIGAKQQLYIMGCVHSLDKG